MSNDTGSQRRKEEILNALYRSVSRMNEAIVSDNVNRYQAEYHLQKNLRRNFEDLDGRAPSSE